MCYIFVCAGVVYQIVQYIYMCLCWCGVLGYGIHMCLFLCGGPGCARICKCALWDAGTMFLGMCCMGACVYGDGRMGGWYVCIHVFLCLGC